MPRGNSHQHQHVSKWFFLIISAITLYIFWRVIEPFALTLITAAIVAVVLIPVDAQLSRIFKHDKFRAFILSALTFALIIAPLFAIGIMIIFQAREVLDLSTTELANFDPATTPFGEILPAFITDSIRSLNVDTLATRSAQWAFSNVGDIFSSTAQLILSIFIFFIALFYFIADRVKIKKLIVELSPFKDTLDDKIVSRIVGTVRGTVFGALILAIVQGAFAAIGMGIFGVPGALIWGSLVVIAAQVPLLGVGLVMIPAIGYLFFTGDASSGIGLLIWSVVVVGLADNILAPVLIKGKTHMNGLLILISVLGGLNLFGSIGFIIGPTILAAVMVLIELYKNGVLEKEPKSIR